MKGVILAGGTGSRLYPLTHATNKHLLPIYDKPMIYHVINTLTKSGITDITIVLGGESVGDFIRLLGDGNKHGATFSYVYQETPGGIAEALYLTKPIIEGEKIAVILGDNIFEETFETEINYFKNTDCNCLLFLKEVDEPERFGVVAFDKEGMIDSIEEKPEKPKSNKAVTGLYFYDENVFNVIQKIILDVGYSKRGELEITDVNNYYINNYKTQGRLLEGFWSDAGTFDTLLKTSNFIKSK